MKDLTGNWDYARLIEEEKEHYSKIEVTKELTIGGPHASSAWRYYWTRVAEEIRSSPFADIGGYLESTYGDPSQPIRTEPR